MYVTVTEITLDAGEEPSFLALNESMHAAMRSMDGLRWVMLLRPVEGTGRWASVAMWLTPAHAHAWLDSEAAAAVVAANPDLPLPLTPTNEYDVVTARGAMTPTRLVALVDWEVDSATSTDFVNRWNSAFHAIEDRVGSRLLQDLSTPTRYTGFHVISAEGQSFPDDLADAPKDAPAHAIAVHHYEVALLTEP